MTTPDGKNPQQSLTERISELEALLARKKLEKHTGRQQPPAQESPAPAIGSIPVLDELVNYDPEEDVGPEPVESTVADPEQINELLDTIEARLGRELESLADSLKQTIKQSILEELKSSRSGSIEPGEDDGEDDYSPGVGYTGTRK